MYNMKKGNKSVTLQSISSAVKGGNLSSLRLAVDISHIGGLSSNATKFISHKKIG